ncbi:actinobacterial surface-anchored protein domain [Dermabacter sp. HFH0086]|uniref:choice-of-anchor M domain-containing protein n=2 Tax=Dermabacteraceae TaxID=85020 RepID=UPI00035282EF|nr:actinobacterial surface-anchored protein domain [Dermabacter sp. HFH0086]MCT1709043.1 choice-of-anchor M domain-containing protein [Dermabacter hominis]
MENPWAMVTGKRRNKTLLPTKDELMTSRSSRALTRRHFAALGAGALGALACAPAALAAPARPLPLDPTDGATDGADDPALKQKVSDDEKIVEGEKVVIDAHHVDLGPRLIDGEWIFAARDDTGETPTWRMVEDIVFQVHDQGILPVPEDEAYSFIKADPGSEVYVVPQTEVSGVVWLGWNTQDPAVVKACPRGVTLRFTNVSGPGHFSLFLQPGNFAPPQQLADGDTLEQTPADVFVDINTHTHANWVFTKPGVYLLAVEAMAEGEDGTKYSAGGTLRFAVGDATAPDEAMQATPAWANDGAPAAGSASDGGSDASSAPGAAKDDAKAKPSKGAADDGASEKTSSNSLPWIVGGGAAVVAAAGGGAYALNKKKNERARAEAESEAAGTGSSAANQPGEGGRK